MLTSRSDYGAASALLAYREHVGAIAMTPIDRISSLSPAAQPGTSSVETAADATRAALGQVGHRVLAWVGAVAPTSAPAEAWTAQAGVSDGFRPDMAELARGGDVYGLKGLTDMLSDRFGATPAQSGELHRALEDFTRAAVVHVAGLSGGSADQQIAAMGQALDASVNGNGAGGNHSGIDGVIDGVNAAAARLSVGLE